MSTTQAYRLKESLHGLDAGVTIYVSDAREVAIQLPHINARLLPNGRGPQFLVPAHYIEPIMVPTLNDTNPIIVDRTAARLRIAIELLAEAVEVLRNDNAMDDSHDELITRIDEALGLGTPECGAMAMNCQLQENGTGATRCLTCSAEFQN